MRTQTIRLGIGLIAIGAVGSSCSRVDGNSEEPPLGFGVDDEAQLGVVLGGYGMSPSQAECVARVAFAANPLTELYADGSYDITQAMLAAGGEDCGVDWSDYDFTTD